MSVHVGEPPSQSVVIPAQPCVFEAEQVQNRGVEIVDGHRILGGLVTNLIGRSVWEPALHAGARQESGEAFGVVIAPAFADALR